MKTVQTWMLTEERELITTPFIVAELDHLVRKRAGADAVGGLREDIDDGAYQVEWWPDAIHKTIAVAEQHESMELGLSDASLVVLAAHLQTTTIATLDERHFRALKPLSGGDAFTLLPTDLQVDAATD